MTDIIRYIRRQQHIASLVYKMCEDEALDQLLSMSFQGFEHEVELSLTFKARNADPRVTPNYGHILYTWYSSRGDFRNGTSTFTAYLFTEIDVPVSRIDDVFACS